jgi:predicted HTH domain antitoxin
MKIEIEVPPEATKTSILEELACALFQKDALSFGQARELAGLGFFEFQKALADRQIPRFTLEMFEEELKYAGHQ